MTDSTMAEIENIMALAEKLRKRVWWLPDAIRWELTKLKPIADAAPPGSDTINITPVMNAMRRQLLRATMEFIRTTNNCPPSYATGCGRFSMPLRRPPGEIRATETRPTRRSMMCASRYSQR